MSDLENVADQIRDKFESINGVRDVAYQRSRKLISTCAKSIRAIHREEWETADTLIAEAKEATDQLVAGVKDYPELYYAGYTQDAVKEFVEAKLTYAFIRDLPIDGPEALGAEANTWLNGLAEATTELRRRILDILRHGHSTEAERLLNKMDEVYSLLVTFDFSDAITRGLRRRTDTVRGVLERTRGDVTNSFRQAELRQALESFEARMSGSEGK